MILPYQHLDGGKIVLGNNRGFQVGTEAEQRNLLRVELIVVNVPHVDIFPRMGNKRIEDKGIQPALFQAVIQRIVINAGGFHKYLGF